MTGRMLFIGRASNDIPHAVLFVMSFGFVQNSKNIEVEVFSKLFRSCTFTLRSLVKHL